MQNVNLTNEEIAMLACATEDPQRKQELQSLLPGTESYAIFFKNITIVNDERGMAHITITKCKNDMDVSKHDHVINFSTENVEAICELIKTFTVITDLQQ